MGDENRPVTGGKSFEGYFGGAPDATSQPPRNIIVTGRGNVVDCSVRYVGTSRSYKGFTDENGNHMVRVTSTEEAKLPTSAKGLDEHGNEKVTIEAEDDLGKGSNTKDKKSKRSGKKDKSLDKTKSTCEYTLPKMSTNQSCMTNNVSVVTRNGVTHIVCARNEIVINGTKFQAHLLTGVSGFKKPSMDHLSISSTGLEIWDSSSLSSGPYIEFDSDLCVTLEFKSNGKNMTLKRATPFTNFHPSNDKC